MYRKKCLLLSLSIILSIDSYTQDSITAIANVITERAALQEALLLSLEALEALPKKNNINEYDLLQVHITNSRQMADILKTENDLLTLQLQTNRQHIDTFNVRVNKKTLQHQQVLKIIYKQKLLNNDLLHIISSISFHKTWLKYRYSRQFENFVKKEKQQLIALKENRERTNKTIEGKLINIKYNRNQLERTLLDLEEEEERLAMIVKKLKRDKAKTTSQIKAKETFKQQSQMIIIKDRKDPFSLTPNPEDAKVDSNNPENRSFTSKKRNLIWPVNAGFIAEKFGRRPHDIVPNIWVENNGVGIMTHVGENVKAVHKGQIKETPKITNEGYMIIIEHGDFLTSYFTLASIFVNKGDWVNEGQIIGNISKSPSSQPILRFEIWKGYNKLDPAQWLQKR
ncbi:MAG: M23 family metallopeptidase [Saprospiraceae bacterium]